MPLKIRKKTRKTLTCIVLFFLSALPAYADIVIGSWNIQNFGWDNQKNLSVVAQITNHFDLLAIQEVMNGQAMETLESEVEALSGESWSWMASHALGRSTYREHYAFLWRDSSVDYLDGAVVYIDDRDVFAREPYSARFRSLRTGTEFALGTVHITYGRNVGDRLPEVEALASYWSWLTEVYSDSPIILAGDFNLRPSHQGWSSLLALGAEPMITEGATTLSSIDGRYANLYDNIWLSEDTLEISQKGILTFPALFGMTHEQARSVVSDHTPVFIALANAILSPATQDTPDGAESGANVTISNCIELNSATAEDLERLPNIGSSRAQQIVNNRPWKEVSDLKNISGIGNSHLSDIKDSKLLCT
nr:helix-hairpin-helix domain-containing protein [uncultured Halomonas sp.]